MTKLFNWNDKTTWIDVRLFHWKQSRYSNALPAPEPAGLQRINASCGFWPCLLPFSPSHPPPPPAMPILGEVGPEAAGGQDHGALLRQVLASQKPGHRKRIPSTASKKTPTPGDWWHVHWRNTGRPDSPLFRHFTQVTHPRLSSRKGHRTQCPTS